MTNTPEELIDEAPPAGLRLPLAAGAVAGLLFVSFAVAMVSEGRGRPMERLELPPIVVEESEEAAEPDPADTIVPERTEPAKPQPREQPRYQGKMRQDISESDPVLAAAPPVTTPLITKAPPPPSFWIEARRAAAAAGELARSEPGGGGAGARAQELPSTGRRVGATSYGLGGSGDAPLGSDVWSPLLDATSGIWQPRDLDGPAIH